MTVSRVLALGYSALVLGAVVAPALVIENAGDRGGLRAPADADLVVVSVVVGVPAATLAWRRLHPPASPRRSGTDVWIAALISFGVLAGAASALPAVVLHATTGLAALDAEAGWRVPAVWAGSQLTAVASGEATHRAVLRWLAGGPTPGS